MITIKRFRSEGNELTSMTSLFGLTDFVTSFLGKTFFDDIFGEHFKILTLQHLFTSAGMLTRPCLFTYAQQYAVPRPELVVKS